MNYSFRLYKTTCEHLRSGLPKKLAAACLLLTLPWIDAGAQRNNSISAPTSSINCLDPNISPDYSSFSICQSSSAQNLLFPFSNPVNNPSTFSVTWTINPSPGIQTISNAPLSNSPISIPLPANLPAGTYSGAITVMNDGGCISPSYPITINILSSPRLGNDTSSAICAGSAFNLNNLFNTSNLTASWTLNGNAVVNPASVSQAGNYSLIVTNQNGCKDTAIAMISVTPAPSASFSYPSGACSNLSPTINPIFSGSGGGTFSGSAGLSINSSTGAVNAASTAAGNYTVTYTIPAQGGCAALSVSANITIKSLPVITTQPSDTSVCKFNLFSFSSNATGSPAPTVQWQVSTDGGVTFTNISGANQNIYNGGTANANQDLWIYRAVYSNECGSVTTRNAIFRVTAPLNPQDNPISATGCNGIGTVTFFASGNGGNGTLGSVWQYSPDGGQTWYDIPSTWTYTNTGNIANTYSFTPTLSQNGYLFRLRFDNGRCPGSVSGSATLSVNPIPTMNQPDSQIVCAGNTVQPVIFSGTANSYSWTNNNTSIGLAASGTGNVPFFTAINNSNTVQTATITVTPIYTGGNPAVSCPGPPRTFTITVNPAPTAYAGPSFTICQGGSLAISGSIGGSATGATWSAPSGTFSNPNSLSTTYTSAIGSGSVTLTLTTNDPDGAGPCVPATSTTVISLSTPATVDAGAPQRVCSGGTVTLNGSFGGSASSATWSAPSGSFSNSTLLNSTYTPSITSGSVMLTLTTNDPAGPCPFVSAYLFITVDTRPTANAGPAQTTCSGAPITLSGTVGGSATSGTWSASSGTFSNTNALNSTYTPSISSGTVVLTLTTDSVPGSPCPRVSSTVTITVLANPVVTASGTAISCNGGNNGTATASSTGSGLSYSWNTNPQQNGSSINNLAAGTYVVTVTDNKGCKGTASVTISQPPPIVLTTSQVNVNCAGGNTGSASVSATAGTPGYTYSWNTSPIQTGSTAINLSAGNYTVTVTDSRGCVKTGSVSITQNPVIILSETHVNVSCAGGNNGSAVISATGGTPPYSGTGTVTGLSAGTYTYTVTDALGCSKSINVTITQPPALAATALPVNVSCNGGSNGSVTINASGGTPAYSGTGNFTGLAAGNYSYTVTDANGCSIAVPFSINQPALLTATETHVNVSCFGGNNGSATISASGGTGPYTGTGTINNLSAGTYTYTVTDSKGCTATVSVTITQPPSIVLTPTQTNASCFGLNNGSASVSAAGGTPGYTYNWSTSPSQSTATATNLSPGNYTVTVTDSKGCVKTNSFTITQPTALSLTAAPIPVSCNGGANGAVTINASGGTAPYSGTGTYSGLTAGTYSYTVTDAGGCTKSISVTITQPTVLAVTATPSPVSCNGGSNGSVIISASGGTAPYSGTGTFTGLSAGTFTYSVTDAGGCIKSVTFSISQPAPVTATETHVNVSCFGGNNGSATITASGGTGPYTGTGTINNLSAGSYTYTVTDSKGCTATVAVTITQPPLLTLSPAQVNISCNGLNNGSASVTAVGGTAGYTYNWNTSPSQSTSGISNLSTGSYTVTVTDSKGCSKTATVSITQPAALTVSETHLNILCNGAATGSATINASGGTAPYSGTGTFSGLIAGNYNYTVTDANGCSKTIALTITQPTALVVTETHINVSCNGGSNGSVTISATGGTLPYSGTGTFTGLSAGNYNYTVTDGNGCTKIVPLTITAPAALTATAIPTAVSCNGGSNGSVTVTAAGGTAPYTGTGTFSNLIAGTYFYTITDSKGCQFTVSAQVTQPLALSVSAVPSNVLCNGQSTGSVMISATGGTTPYSGTGTFTGLAAGSYTYTVTDSKGCSKSTGITITQPTALVVTGNATNVSCYGGNNGTASVSATGGTPPYSGAGTFSGLAAGTYNYAVTDANGCSRTYTAIITQPPAIILTETHTAVTCYGGSNGTVTITATGGTAPYSGTGLITGLSAGNHTFTVTDSRGCTASVNVSISQPPQIIVTETHTNVSCNGTSTGSATISASGGTGLLSGTGTFTGLAFGPHVFTVTDANGCQRSITVNITQGTTLQAAATQTNVSCYGRSNGSVTVTATGGTSPYSGTGTFNNLGPGDYTYFVTDANGCGSFVNVTITQPDSLIINNSTVNVLCFGGNTGSIQITAQGGTAPYSGTGLFSTLTAGTYNYTVTDAKGCSAVKSVVITQPPALAAAGITGSVSCHGGSDGTVTITATGGTAPYSGTGTFSGLQGGNYTYTVSDNAGCQVQVPFSISEPTALSISANVQPVSCFNGNNGSVIINAGGGTGPYSGTGSFTGLPAGSYTYTITDGNGCSKTANVSITQPAQLNASISSTAVSCFGGADGTVTITAQGGTAPYSGTGTFSGISAGTSFYTVNDANGCTVPLSATLGAPTQLIVNETHTQVLCNGGNDATATISASGGTAPYSGTGLFTGLGLGTHDFTVTDTKGCQQTITVNITQATSLTASETHTNVTCNGGSNGTALISAAGGSGPYTGTGTFSGLAAGTYNYPVTDANNCTAIVTVIITEPGPINVIGTNNPVSCSGGSNGSTVISASGGTGPYSGTGTFTGLTAGSYDYTVTDASGCTAQATMIITEPAILSATSIPQDLLCHNDNSGQITVNASGGVSPYTGTGIFSGLSAGTYNYQVTDANGCQAATTAVITEPALMTLSETNTQILCNGGSNGSATISATGGTAPYSGTGLFTGLGLGTHDFTVSDANGCQKTITVNITQATTLTVTETHTPVTCFGGNDGTAIITAAGGTAPYTGTGTFTGLTAGTHQFTVTDAAGCQAIATLIINQPDMLVASATKTDVSCHGVSNGSIAIQASGGLAPYTGIGMFTGLSAGPYNYTITDAIGCTVQASAVINEPESLTAHLVSEDALCNGVANGTMIISASGGTAPYTGTGTFSGLGAGNYNYTVSDANGCNTSVNGIIAEPAALILTESHTQIACNGGANGSATIMAAGGTAPYIGTGSFTGLSLGNHDFTVTDARGCQKTITVNITQATSLVASETHTNINCQGENNGSVIISATGGTAPYSGTGSFSGLQAGNYSYTVTDASGCQSIVNVAITEPAALSASATGYDVSCHGGSNGSIDVSASGGTMPYSGTGNFTGLPEGTYSYSVTDANGCSAQVSAVIASPPPLTGSAIAEDALCHGAANGTVSISASGGTAPYNGTGMITGLIAGNYSYTVTDANGCNSIVNAVIAEPSPLILNETHTQIPCTGRSTASATITATGGTGPYSGTGTFSGLGTGPHVFTVTDAKGCQKSITVIITQASQMTISETHNNVTCHGMGNGSITLSATGGTPPYTGAGSIYGLSAGTYTYNITDATGCSSSIQVTVTQPDSMTGTISKSDISCHGGSNGTISISASGGTMPYNGTGLFTGLGAGNYAYSVTDANGCSIQLSASLSEPEVLQVDALPSNPDCSDPLSGSIVISATGGVAPYTGTGTYTGLGTGNYQYIITDQNSCTAITNVLLTMPDSIDLRVNDPAPVCPGTTVDLTQTAVTSGSSQGLSYAYWTDAAGTIALNNPAAVNNSGTYYISANNASGCSEIKPVSISALPVPGGTLSGGGSICEGSTANLILSLTGMTPFTVTYSDGISNRVISGINANSYSMTVSPAATTSYSLISVKDANCTGTGTGNPVTVMVNPAIPGMRYADIRTSPNIATPVDARDLGSNYRYDWSPGIGLLSYSTRSTTFYYDQTVEYLIRISNGSGCDVVDTVKVIVERNAEDEKSGIWVPNAWSPNGSGKNDLLRPLCLNIAEIRFFRVFNRWGQMMFETNRMGEGWNGVWKGKPQINDVYTWTLEAYGIDGKRYFKSGNSILLR